MLVAIAGVIVLDVRGYSFSARGWRVAEIQTAVVIALCVAFNRTLVRVIDRHVERSRGRDAGPGRWP